MKFAILTNNANYYHKPLAEGLQRMFSAIGEEATVFYEGHLFLQQPLLQFTANPKHLAYQYLQQRKLNKFFAQLKAYDVIIFVEGIPDAFQKKRYTNIEAVLRKRFPEKPIVNYSNYYLLTLGPWIDWLKNGDPNIGLDNNNYGLERYDWYLATTWVSEWVPPKIDNPVSVVGLNLEDGRLHTKEKSDFFAIVDFERPKFMQERMIQLRALEETNTPYITLHGRYSSEKIREIYRKASMCFLAHRESFGVPICELQACGAYIFSPYAAWSPGHYLKEDIYQAGEGKLSDNFVVYNNDLELLKKKLEEVKQTYQANKVREHFLASQPQFYYGDTEALKDFVNKIKQGAITSRSHEAYTDLINQANT